MLGVRLVHEGFVSVSVSVFISVFTSVSVRMHRATPASVRHDDDEVEGSVCSRPLLIQHKHTPRSFSGSSFSLSRSPPPVAPSVHLIHRCSL
jgi:hypothetical protein